MIALALLTAVTLTAPRAIACSMGPNCTQSWPGDTLTVCLLARRQSWRWATQGYYDPRTWPQVRAEALAPAAGGIFCRGCRPGAVVTIDVPANSYRIEYRDWRQKVYLGEGWVRVE